MTHAKRASTRVQRGGGESGLSVFMSDPTIATAAMGGCQVCAAWMTGRRCGQPLHVSRVRPAASELSPDTPAPSSPSILGPEPLRRCPYRCCDHPLRVAPGVTPRPPPLRVPHRRLVDAAPRRSHPPRDEPASRLIALSRSRFSTPRTTSSSPSRRPASLLDRDPRLQRRPQPRPPALRRPRRRRRRRPPRPPSGSTTSSSPPPPEAFASTRSRPVLSSASPSAWRKIRRPAGRTPRRRSTAPPTAPPTRRSSP